MSISIRVAYFFASMTITFCAFFNTLHANAEVIKPLIETNKVTKKSLENYLLPKQHPLQEHIKSFFIDPHMFDSPDHFKRAGFTVKLGHNKLMVGGHSSLPHYLFKKFTEQRTPSFQLKNFIKRIDGAKIVRKCIQKHNFKHLIVPQKWIYKLSHRFSSKQLKSAYILIVDNMDIYDKKENLRLYYNMDKEILTELCTVLYEIGGCDAFPRNQPFTRSGKIAFVDTEHVGKMPGHFIEHIVPALNPELQAYALALWEKLKAEN